MDNLLYFIAALLVILWVLGYYAFSLGGAIHFLLVVAVIVLV
ncbi:MAG: lmo0937 family membrane protein, partial [Chryseotalea sp.]